MMLSIYGVFPIIAPPPPPHEIIAPHYGIFTIIGGAIMGKNRFMMLSEKRLLL